MKTHNFTTRRLEPKPSKLFHRLALLTILISSFFAFQAAQDAFWHGVDHAQAREALTFAQELPWRKIILPVEKPLQKRSGYWTWPGQPAYKNERLAAYQDMLRARGITDTEHLKLLTAQLVQENGAIDEKVIGDKGCSFGLLQYNACAHHKMSAKAFLSKPQWKEWNDWRFQLERMADMVAERNRIYDGKIRCVVVHHNGPAFAQPCTKHADTPAGYFRAVQAKTALLAI